MVSNVVMTQITSSAVVVYLIQKLKAASWFPLAQAGRTWANRIISAGMAAVTALGVSYTWNPQTRGLLLTIPTLSVAAIGFWHWLNQYVTNELVYRVAVPGAGAASTPGVQPAAAAQQGVVGKPVTPAK
jgi:hypothetical protein